MKRNENNKPISSILVWLFVFVSLLFITNLFRESVVKEEIPYSEFKKLVRDGKIKSVVVTSDNIHGEYEYIDNGGNKRHRKFVTIPLEDPELLKLLDEKNVVYRAQQGSRWWWVFVNNFLPLILLVAVWWFLFFRAAQIGGRQALSFGKSRARLYSEKNIKVTFNDVAGCDEAKEELKEIVEFLKDPKKFQRLGGKMPKGVLLYGAPGTGKTLLAKAVAGEAGVPFFSTSGSEFVEMFVGVGASRVRDLFEQGRRHAPCLLFIDELDAVGRYRFSGIGGGHDEREQTLNQLLVEMDGFDSREGIILIAATNRPDVLDNALLRPGRFDRHIYVSIPDLKGREEILKIHARNVKLSKNVDLKIIARRTPGFVGADLANLINESALLAARKNKEEVEMEDLEEAIERVVAGPQKKSRVISEQEKRIIAYHESGHALLAKLIPGCDPVHKVSIIPRGPSLGYTLQLPLEDKYLISRNEILNRVTVLLGGRAAEEVIFNDMTSGAQNDLLKATEIVQKMICEYGMSERLGPITYRKKEGEVFLGRDIVQQREYSEETARIIDEEVKKVISNCLEDAKRMLSENRNKLEKLAEMLIEREILEGSEIDEILKDEEKIVN
jgi:cell division protease FtsH